MIWILLAWNAVVFILYGVDKWRAKNGIWRISEAVLLLSALLGGAFGAASGMIAFHHKVSKTLFRFVVPLAIFVNLFTISVLIIHS